MVEDIKKLKTLPVILTYQNADLGLIFETLIDTRLIMLVIILLITFISIITLCIGFFEIRIPFLSIPANEYQKFKIRVTESKHQRKMARKRMWYNEIHKGFIDLLT